MGEPLEFKMLLSIGSLKVWREGEGGTEGERERERESLKD